MLRITVGGLMGGHSGENINDGRANANKLAGELLGLLFSNCGIELISFDGGSKDNAIPREAVLVIVAENYQKVRDIVSDFESKVREGLCADDEGFFLSCEDLGDSKDSMALSQDATRRVISFVNSVENGVLAMSANIEGLVEYSRNLGIVKTESDKIGFYFSSRSAIDDQLEDSKMLIEKSAAALGGKTEHHSRYPGWNYTGSSELADRYVDTAKRLCGVDVEKTALHAGLECGIVKEAIPDMEIISCGPDIKNLHSPQESLGIASFERFFTVIKDIVENI